MFGVVIGIHILICAMLMVVVLLQSGKGGGLAGAFGGAGGIGAVFGGQSAATFLTKATRYLAIGFMLTSLLLALLVRGTIGGGTIATGLRERAATPASGVEGAAPVELPPPTPEQGTADQPQEGEAPAGQ